MAIATGTWLLFLDPPTIPDSGVWSAKPSRRPRWSVCGADPGDGEPTTRSGQRPRAAGSDRRSRRSPAVMVIAKMLGCPAADLDKLRHWADELSRVVDPLRSLGDYEYLNEVAGEMIDYFRRLIGERRLALGEDRLSALITAREQEDKLSENELLSICIFLFVAGKKQRLT